MSFVSSVFLFSMVAMLATASFVWLASLKFGINRARPDQPCTWKMAIVIWLLCFVTALPAMLAAAPLAFLFQFMVYDETWHWLQDMSLQAIVSVVAATIAVRIYVGLNWRSSFRACLPLAVTTQIPILLSLLVIRPFVFDSFAISTNAMAPTLVGNHFEVTCEECGAIAYGSAYHDRSAQLVDVICEQFHCTKANPAAIVPSEDRVLFAKFIVPERWDIVSFQYPAEPSIIYAKRVVGLPGEEIVIRRGQVFANGTLLVPPPRLTGLTYHDILQYDSAPTHGSENRPAKLGKDEYFMLGDYSLQSSDSRLWQVGAPGRPPYAVPQENILGVGTHVFWPYRRWRELR